MNCRDVQSLESNYLDAELPEELCDRVRHHLLRCNACRQELDSLRMAVEVYKETHTQPHLGEAFIRASLESLATDLGLPTPGAETPGQLILMQLEHCPATER